MRKLSVRIHSSKWKIQSYSCLSLTVNVASATLFCNTGRVSSLTLIISLLQSNSSSLGLIVFFFFFILLKKTYTGYIIAFKNFCFSLLFIYSPETAVTDSCSFLAREDAVAIMFYHEDIFSLIFTV